MFPMSFPFPVGDDSPWRGFIQGGIGIIASPGENVLLFFRPVDLLKITFVVTIFLLY
jgi:hypothetical protein